MIEEDKGDKGDNDDSDDNDDTNVVEPQDQPQGKRRRSAKAMKPATPLLTA